MRCKKERPGHLLGSSLHFPSLLLNRLEIRTQDTARQASTTRTSLANGRAIMVKITCEGNLAGLQGPVGGTACHWRVGAQLEVRDYFGLGL